MQELAVILTNILLAGTDPLQHSKDFVVLSLTLGSWLPEIIPDVMAHFERGGSIKQIGQFRANNHTKIYWKPVHQITYPAVKSSGFQFPHT